MTLFTKNSQFVDYTVQLLKDHPELKDVGRVTLWQSLMCVRLTLWDEDTKQLVSFRDARRRMALS